MAWIDLPDTPPVPGLRYRHFAGGADYEAMVRILNDISIAQDEEPFATAQMMIDHDANQQTFDPMRDRIVAEVDGVFIGVGRIDHYQTVEGERVYFHSFNLDPKWKGRDISRPVLHYHERRLRELAATEPDDGPKYIAPFGINDLNTNAVELFTSEGYTPARFGYEMARPIAPGEQIAVPPLPAGIELRPIRDEHLRPMWDARQEAYRDLWNYIEQPDSAFEVHKKDPHWRKDLSAVAWEGDQVVGHVLVYIAKLGVQRTGRKRGWTETIFVRRPWRKKGIARAMIAHCLAALQREGMTEAALGVDTDNPSGALRLYESMGYRPIGRSTWYRKPLV